MGESPKYGSKPVISEEIRYVNVPPYWGVPRLSHQFPVLVVVAVTVVGVVVGLTILAVVEVLGVDVIIDVAVVDVDGAVTVEAVVVAELQDAKSNDTTNRQANKNVTNLLFIPTS
jgi:hypothetical protein